MAKIRDLGINFIPETMRPPEIGAGGGGCGQTHTPPYNCQHTFLDLVLCANCFTSFGCTTSPPQQGAAMYQAGTCTPCNTTPPNYGMMVLTCTPCNSTPPNATMVLTCTPCNSTPPTSGTTGLTRESIAELRRMFEQKIAELDEHAKNLGPKSLEEIEKREKELKAELDDLAKRRKTHKETK